MAEIHSEDGNGNGNDAAGSWLIQIEREYNLQMENSLSFPSVSIYRVPKSMKVSMEEAYVPQVVAFGPYYRALNPHLSAMDKHKVGAVHRTLSRMKGVTIEILIQTINGLETKIRDCYEESIHCKGKTFAWMFTMDACFILDFLVTKYSWSSSLSESDAKNDTILLKQCMIPQRCPVWEIYHYNLLNRTILTDIMKLENQIPLFIFKKILELEYGGGAVCKLCKILNFLQLLPPFSKCSGSPQLNEDIIRKACHLLDVFRRIKQTFFTGSSMKSPKERNVVCHNLTSLACICNLQAWTREPDWSQWRKQSDNPLYKICIPSAESLKKVGVKFKPAKNGKVQFKRRMLLRGSTLFLPPFFVVDSSETYLRNLLAFEECHKWYWGSDCVVSSLMLLMDLLINSETDVAILRKAGIINLGAAGDGEVAAMFNKVCKGVSFPPVREVILLTDEIREYYHGRFNRCITQFKEEYCSKPWHIISLVAAIIALTMTAVQTYYSIKTYKDDH